MLSRDEWLPLARKLDWEYSYVREEDVFPEVISGRPWLAHSEWKEWEESFKTSYREYVDNQYEKDMAVYAARCGWTPGQYSKAGCTVDERSEGARRRAAAGRVHRRHRKSPNGAVWPRQRLANHGHLWRPR